MLVNVDVIKWAKEIETMNYDDPGEYLRVYESMMVDAGLDPEDPEVSSMIREGANLWRLNYEFEKKFEHLFRTKDS